MVGDLLDEYCIAEAFSWLDSNDEARLKTSSSAARCFSLRLDVSLVDLASSPPTFKDDTRFSSASRNITESEREA
jgi:hypothetical protein